MADIQQFTPPYRRYISENQIVTHKTRKFVKKYFFREGKDKTNHFDYVDALRGFAILLVIMVHSIQQDTFSMVQIVKNIANNGQMGVQLFYLASAFTLFLSMKNRSLKEKYPIRNFFIRRFFRIAPLYYLAIVFFLWLNGFGARYWLGDATHISVANIVSNVFFLHGLNPYWINSLVPGGWSIGVEMMFYALLPFLFLKIKNINQAFKCLIITILIRFALDMILGNFDPTHSDHLWNEYLYFYLPSQLPVFALGIILYFIIIEKQSLTELSGKSLLIFGLIIFVQFFTGKQSLLPIQITFGAGFLVFAVALSRYKFKLFVNQITTYIGKISFSMYLAHFAVLSLGAKTARFILRYLSIDYYEHGYIYFGLCYLIIVMLTIIVSILLYHIVEIPFQKIGKNIIETKEKK